MKITQIEIENYCKSFLMESYNLDLTIPIKINSRTTTTLGSFIHSKKNGAIRLEFSKKFFQNGEIVDIYDTMRHECIHYALYVKEKPFRDGDRYFEDELIKYNTTSTGMTDVRYERNVRVYSCKCDEHIFLATIRPSKCTKCNSVLEYKERRKQLM